MPPYTSASNTPPSAYERPPRRAAAVSRSYRAGIVDSTESSDDSGGFELYDLEEDQPASNKAQEAAGTEAKAKTAKTRDTSQMSTLPADENAPLAQAAPTTKCRRRGIKGASEGLAPAPGAALLNEDERESYRPLELARPAIVHRTGVGFVKAQVISDLKNRVKTNTHACSNPPSTVIRLPVASS